MFAQVHRSLFRGNFPAIGVLSGLAFSTNVSSCADDDSSLSSQHRQRPSFGGTGSPRPTYWDRNLNSLQPFSGRGGGRGWSPQAQYHSSQQEQPPPPTQQHRFSPFSPASAFSAPTGHVNPLGGQPPPVDFTTIPPVASVAARFDDGSARSHSSAMSGISMASSMNMSHSVHGIPMPHVSIPQQGMPMLNISPPPQELRRAQSAPPLRPYTQLMEEASATSRTSRASRMNLVETTTVEEAKSVTSGSVRQYAKMSDGDYRRGLQALYKQDEFNEHSSRTGTNSFVSACNEMNLTRMHRGTIRKDFDENSLKYFKERGIEWEDTAIQYIVDDMVQGRGGKSSEDYGYLTANEEEYLCRLMDEYALAGAPISKPDIEAAINSIISLRVDDEYLRPVSSRMVDQYLARHKVRARKTSSLGTEKLDACRPIVRDTYFSLADSYCHMQHCRDPIGWPWQSLAEMPAECIANMDEVNFNPLGHPHPVLVSQDFFRENNYQQITATSEGNKGIKGHGTIALTSCANGLYHYPGAGQRGCCGIQVIWASPGAEDDVPSDPVERAKRLDDFCEETLKGKPVPQSFYRGLLVEEYDDKGEPVAVKNPLGVRVSISNKGSQTKETLMEFGMHLRDTADRTVYRLGSGDLSKKPLLLFIDGHGSRWSVAFLRFMRSIDVHCFFIPAQASFFGQPNDRGPNFLIHTSSADAAKEIRQMQGQDTSSSSTNQEELNQILSLGLKKFFETEMHSLATTRSNKATSGMAFTGLKPVNPHSKGWEYAISLGRFHDRKQEAAAEKYGDIDDALYTWVPRVRDSGDRVALTDEEKALIEAVAPQEMFTYGEGSNSSWDNDMIERCYTIARLVVDKTDPATKNQFKYGEDPETIKDRLAPEERAALKLVRFIRSDKPIAMRPSVPINPREIGVETVTNILKNVALNHPVKFRDEDDVESTAIKVREDEFLLVKAGGDQLNLSIDAFARSEEYKVQRPAPDLSNDDLRKAFSKKTRDSRREMVQKTTKAKAIAKKRREHCLDVFCRAYYHEMIANYIKNGEDSTYEDNGQEPMEQLLEYAESPYMDRIEIDDDLIDVLLQTDEGAMSELARKSVSHVLLSSHGRNKRDSKRIKGPGQGVPGQKYGLDSATTYLGMLKHQHQHKKNQEKKKAKSKESAYASCDLWIRDAEKVKSLYPNAYWIIEGTIGDLPNNELMKTVLRMKELKTSGKQLERFQLLQEEGVTTSQVDWDAKLAKWKQDRETLKRELEGENESAGMETGASAAAGGGGDTNGDEEMDEDD